MLSCYLVNMGEALTEDAVTIQDRNHLWHASRFSVKAKSISLHHRIGQGADACLSKASIPALL